MLDLGNPPNFISQRKFRIQLLSTKIPKSYDPLRALFEIVGRDHKRRIYE